MTRTLRSLGNMISSTDRESRDQKTTRKVIVILISPARRTRLPNAHHRKT